MMIDVDVFGGGGTKFKEVVQVTYGTITAYDTNFDTKVSSDYITSVVKDSTNWGKITFSQDCTITVAFSGNNGSTKPVLKNYAVTAGTYLMDTTHFPMYYDMYYANSYLLFFIA